MFSYSRIKSIDWALVLPVVYLLAIGLVTLYAIAFKTRGIAVEFDYTAQILALAAGVVTIFALAFFRPKVWRKVSIWLYILSVILLAAVLVFGETVNGAQRWLQLGSLQLQPVEFAKVTTILLLAKRLDYGTRAINRMRPLLETLAIAGIPFVLTALQPDLGSALVFVIIWFGMIFASRLRLMTLFLLVAFALGSVMLAVPQLADYQQERLISFVQPGNDVQGVNYNARQASIAIGSGGIFGNGLDSGTQSQLNFLPSQHTDFIFAVIAEKLGLIGAGSVILAFILLSLRLGFVSFTATTQYQRLIVSGVIVLLLFHSLVNIGMNLGVTPVTGLPLPFVSFGGTFLYTSLVLLGLAVVVQQETTRQQSRPGSTKLFTSVS